MELKPTEIFYSQDSICKTFGDHCAHRGQLIGETLDNICDGRCTIYDIPRIKVINRNGKWVTCDNRRLWVFRHLERLGKCDKIYVQTTSYIPIQKLTSLSDGQDIKVRGRPGGVWHNKPSKRREPLTPKPLSYNRRVYDTDTPSPRPLSNMTSSSTTSTPNYTTNFQHTNMIHKQAEVQVPAKVAPSSIRFSSQQGLPTRNYDDWAGSSTRSSVHSNDTRHSAVSSMFGQNYPAQQVEPNWHQPTVRPHAAPQDRVSSDMYSSDRENRPVTHSKIYASPTLKPKTGYTRTSERKTTSGNDVSEVTIENVSSRPADTRDLSRQPDTVIRMPTDDYPRRQGIAKPCSIQKNRNQGCPCAIL